MNIIVVGLGSMGKRRLRLIKNHYPDEKIFGVDNNVDRRKFSEEEYNIRAFSELKEALVAYTYDAAFVCTSPLSHNNIISTLLSQNIHVFSELNLVSDGYVENIDMAERNKLTLFLSSTALYRKETQYIVKKVEEQKQMVCYNYHVGQYLPDWHPWEDYTDFFVKDKRTNGCREILAIEMPWITKAFGEVEDLKVTSGKSTNLDIDYNDFFMIQIKHKNGNVGSFIVDLISRESVRNIEVFGEKLYIKWNGTPDSLQVKNIKTKELEAVNLYKKIDKLENYSSSIIENQYLDEINAFFEEIKGVKDAEYGFKQDMDILRILDRIEEISRL